MSRHAEGAPPLADRSPAAAAARRQLLRTLRSKYGLSQARAAALAGVTVDTWSRWERGVVAVPPRSCQAAVAGITGRRRGAVKKAVRR